MKKKKGSVAKVLLIILAVVLALVLVAIMAGAVIWQQTLNSIPRAESSVETLAPEIVASIENETDPVDPDFTGPELDPTDIVLETIAIETTGGEVTQATQTTQTTQATQPTKKPEPVKLIESDDLINILLIGQDRLPGQGRQRSDSMILCTLNTRTNTLTMTSFLRDMYVSIPGYQNNRLNAAYAFGGMPLLNKCFEVNFGIKIDGNIEVDFNEFQKIIDLMGGVSISLTQKEADYLNSQDSTWGLVKGSNRLSGEVALAYARIRKLDNDFGRTNRQRKVLTSLINQSRSIGLSSALELLQTVLGLITTDMSNGEITRYVTQVVPMLSSLEVKTQSIPASGTYTSARVRGMAVLIPDLSENRDYLRETLLG